MTTDVYLANVPQVDEATMEDDELREVIERAALTKSPPPQWYRTMGNNPEVAKAFRALKIPLRTNSNRSPWSWFVPERMVKLATAVCPPLY